MNASAAPGGRAAQGPVRLELHQQRGGPVNAFAGAGGRAAQGPARLELHQQRGQPVNPPPSTVGGVRGRASSVGGIARLRSVLLMVTLYTVNASGRLTVPLTLCSPAAWTTYYAVTLCSGSIKVIPRGETSSVEPMQCSLHRITVQVCRAAVAGLEYPLSVVFAWPESGSSCEGASRRRRRARGCANGPYIPACIRVW